MPPQSWRPGHCVCGRPDCLTNARLVRRLCSAFAVCRPRLGSKTADTGFRRWLEPLARVSITPSDISTYSPLEKE
jgi:hypothetical protein